MNRLRLSPPLLVALLLGTGSSTATGLDAAPPLTVMVVVDQLCPDYLERFEPHFRGFFAELLDRGRRFVDAEHHHAWTVTGAGHASLGTGRHPRRHGIVQNGYFDATSNQQVRSAADPSAGPVEGEGGGSSARNLLCDGLGDWMKRANPESKVYGFSGKPRGSIFLTGQHPDAAFWFDDKAGAFLTSDYYLSELPEWLKEFHSSMDRSWYPEVWTTTLSPEEFEAAGCSADDQRGEDLSGYPPSSMFPHGLGPGRPEQWGLLELSPWGDQIVLDLALLAVEEEELGLDDAPDLLALALSSTDRIGHVHGPHSWEMMEQVIALDSMLSEFFVELEELVGNECLVVLTADHGVCPLPERQQDHELPGGRLALPGLFAELSEWLKDRYDVSADQWFTPTSTGIRLHGEALEAAGLEVPVVARELAESMAENELVHAAFTRFDWESPEQLDLYSRLQYHSYHPDRCGDVFLVAAPYFLMFGPTGTTHGSPHDYDRKVPLIFCGPSVQPGTVSGRAHTVDVAPTIAKLLGVPVPDNVDGQALTLSDKTQ